MRRLILAALIAAVPFVANAANVEDERYPASTLGAQLKCRELSAKEPEKNTTWLFSGAFYSRKADRCFFRYVLASETGLQGQLLYDGIAPMSWPSTWTITYPREVQCSDNVKSMIDGCPKTLDAYIETLR